MVKAICFLIASLLAGIMQTADARTLPSFNLSANYTGGSPIYALDSISGERILLPDSGKILVHMIYEASGFSRGYLTTDTGFYRNIWLGNISLNPLNNNGYLYAQGECQCYFSFGISFNFPRNLIRGYNDAGQVLMRGGDNGERFRLTNVTSGTGTDFSNVMLGVPEPSTWAMMLLGFGLVGALVRRQRRVHCHLRHTTVTGVRLRRTHAGC